MTTSELIAALQKADPEGTNDVFVSIDECLELGDSADMYLVLGLRHADGDPHGEVQLFVNTMDDLAQSEKLMAEYLGDLDENCPEDRPEAEDV